MVMQIFKVLMSKFGILAIFAILFGLDALNVVAVPTWLLGVAGIGAGAYLLFGR